MFRRAIGGQQTLNIVRNGGGQRDLDENQRLVDERRVEEGVTAPVLRIDTTAQVVPIANLVNRLVADDLFEDIGRRAPVDVAQDEKARIEPGREQSA